MDHLISPEPAQLIGVIGAITYLLSYALLQAGLLHGNSYTYAALNGAGALMVMVSLIHAFNLASLLIQISFLAVSVLGIVRMAYPTSKARFSAEERAGGSTGLPDPEANETSTGETRLKPDESPAEGSAGPRPGLGLRRCQG